MTTADLTFEGGRLIDALAALDALRPGLADTGVSLARRTQVHIGGRADLFVRPRTADELLGALSILDRCGVPFIPLGLGGNLLMADDGFRGAVIRLTGALCGVRPLNERGLVLGAGRNNRKCAKDARVMGLSGLEFLEGIPGTPGGGVRMNAGAYRQEFKCVVTRVHVVSPAGAYWMPASMIELAHRSSRLPPASVVAEVEVDLAQDDPDAIGERMEQNRIAREKAQPAKSALTFGSVFINPRDIPGSGSDDYAGALIESCGLKGTTSTSGHARISPDHANWIENDGAATAEDVLSLMNLARSRVKDASGVELQPEVILAGDIHLDPL